MSSKFNSNMRQKGFAISKLIISVLLSFVIQACGSSSPDAIDYYEGQAEFGSIDLDYCDMHECDDSIEPHPACEPPPGQEYDWVMPVECRTDPYSNPYS
jgi:hypothetical protein